MDSALDSVTSKNASFSSTLPLDENVADSALNLVTSENALISSTLPLDGNVDSQALVGDVEREEKKKIKVFNKKPRLNILNRPPRPEIDQSWTLMRIVTEHVPDTWEAVFKEAMPELKDVDEILRELEKEEGPYFPLKKDLFRAFEMTPLPDVRVVIVGQDPYHDTYHDGTRYLPRAQGLSFSVNRKANLPPSLINIYREIKRTHPEFIIPAHGDLSEWARQGVLLLNACLTVKPRCPASHGSIWMGFINRVVNAINAVNKHCIYVLWGNEAQKLARLLPGSVHVLTSAHPSGRNKNKNVREPFVGNGHFLKINELLAGHGKGQINWNITV